MVNLSTLPEPSDSKHQKPCRSTQKLSDERLARKRALDREAQRSSRCKTKNHIALLESRIEALTRLHDNGNTKELIDQIERQRVENEALQAKLRSIAKLVTGVGEVIPENGVKSSVKPPEPFSGVEKCDPDFIMLEQMEHSQSLDPPIEMGPVGGIRDSNNSSTGSTVEQAYQITDRQLTIVHGATVPNLQVHPMYHLSSGATVGIDPAFSPDQDTPHWGAGDQCSQMTQCSCSKIKNFTSQLLSQCSNLPLKPTPNQNLRDADISIRAVLHGWHAVTRKYLLDPLWSMLRHADEIIFSKCGATERLVVLRNLVLQLRYRSNPNQQNLDAIPYYLHERPSQRLFPHESLIDYIVWPGLRERCVFTPHRYCNAEFTALFWKCFRFTWNYEFRDVYVRDSETGHYMFSKSFDECSRDLSSFCMTNEFLDVYPELRADITATEDETANKQHSIGNEKGMFEVGELDLGDLNMLSNVAVLGASHFLIS